MQESHSSDSVMSEMVVSSVLIVTRTPRRTSYQRMIGKVATVPACTLLVGHRSRVTMGDQSATSAGSLRTRAMRDPVRRSSNARQTNALSSSSPVCTVSPRPPAQATSNAAA